jgi:predicted ester cyclase
MENAKEIVTTFYINCLTVNAGTDVKETLGKILAEKFVSNGSIEIKTKEQLIGQISFFWKLIPDLKWEPQEIINEGNKFVVRSIASGTPNGDFMGLPTNGTKQFRIMTIDIHTVDNGELTTVYHLEDWVTAMKQLKSQ